MSAQLFIVRVLMRVYSYILESGYHILYPVGRAKSKGHSKQVDLPG